MIDFLLVTLVLLAGGVAYAFYAASRAPVGFEDERGFHTGPEIAKPIEDFHGAVPELTR